MSAEISSQIKALSSHGLTPHRWKLSPKEAIRLQREWAPYVEAKDKFSKIKWIAGADLAFTSDETSAIAGMILFEFPSLREVERVHVVRKLEFPYVPGLLSFREGPALTQALKRFSKKPQVVLIDGQGLAHPRRFGIASHMGVLWGIPTIGVAKSLLCGAFQDPPKKRGKWSRLIHRGETVGAVLRTRDGVKPMFISVGHRVSLKSALKIVLQCHGGTRIPIPTREADRYVNELKRKF